MSDPKGKKRRSWKKELGLSLVGLLIVGLGIALASALVSRWAFSLQAGTFAGRAGFDDARIFFAQGRRVVLRMTTVVVDEKFTGPVPHDGEMRRTEEREGGKEVWEYVVNQRPLMFSLWAVDPHAEYIEAFNRSMDFRIKNPGLYDQCGERIPQASPKKKNTKPSQ